MVHAAVEKQTASVLVAGNLVLDVTPVFPEQGQTIYMSDFVPGRLMQMNGIQIHAGGVCGNVGMALASLQTEVTIMAHTCNDEIGDILRRKLSLSGIQSDFMISDQANTSYSIVIAPPGIDRIFLHDPGVSDFFDASDVTDEKLASSKFFHFGYPPLMRKIYQDNGESLADMFRRAKRLGLLTSLDMAFIDPKSPASEVDWEVILSKTLPFVDYFVPSIDEMASIFFPDRYKERVLGDALSLSKDLRPLGRRILALGAKHILIKCGEAGIYYLDADSRTEGFCDAFKPDVVISANGAGDAAVAGFISSIIHGLSFEQSVKCAAAAGALAVSSYNTASAIIPIQDIRHRISSGWRQIHSINE